jgi:asparagine synthase (glutamine-hydrolysing)
MRWLQIFNEATRSEMYQDSFVEQLPDCDPFSFLETAWNKTPDRDLISRASISDMQTYLPCDLMTKVDIASMGNGLEARQPVLDYRLVEFAASLPSHLKYRWRRGKRLLRDAFYDMIPPEIWDRPKMGFGIPIASWFRGPLRQKTANMLLSPDTRCHQYVRPESIQRLIDSHHSERTNEGYRLWNLLMLELWLRRWT